MAATEDTPQETIALTLEEARRLRGSGWGSDFTELDVLRSGPVSDYDGDSSAPRTDPN